MTRSTTYWESKKVTSAPRGFHPDSPISAQGAEYPELSCRDIIHLRTSPQLNPDEAHIAWGVFEMDGDVIVNSFTTQVDQALKIIEEWLLFSFPVTSVTLVLPEGVTEQWPS